MKFIIGSLLLILVLSALVIQFTTHDFKIVTLILWIYVIINGLYRLFNKE